MNTLRDRIRYLRGDLSQEEFAKRLGVSLGSVQNWELNNKIPKGDYLVRFLKRLNIDINWLLTGEGRPYILTENNSNAQNEYVSEKKTGQPEIASTIIQHYELVKQFNDCELAKTANMELLTIERLNPQAFREVVSYIKGISGGLKLGQSKRRTEHSTEEDLADSEDPDIFPSGSDRRTGPGRRKLNGRIII